MKSEKGNNFVQRNEKYRVRVSFDCCISSLAFCSTWCPTNMMVRSAVCVVRCQNKNRKYMTRNLRLFQQVEYLCWFGNLNRLGKYNSVHFGNLPLSDPIPLRIPVTLCGGYGYFLDPHIWHKCEVTIHSILTLQVLCSTRVNR